jgi:acyl-CoA reductase-like NAD-dependent aldehyde dehydrogenase
MIPDLATLLESGWRVAGREAVPVQNPATGETIGHAPLATLADVEAAMEAAHAAFSTWKNSPPQERSDLLHRTADLLQEHLDEIAVLLTREQGKPLADSRKELRVTVRTLRLYAEEALRIEGPAKRGDAGNTFSIALRQPLGPAVAIGPTNYPVELLAWKVAPALAAGCTVIAKPPMDTPLAVAAFVRCLLDAGAPPGVVNLLVGPGSTIGEALACHPLTRKVAFTGSTAVGQRLAALAGERLKPITLELGGSAPLLVFSDADLERAVAGALRRSYSNAGQICIAVNRIYVEASLYRDFADAFAAAAQRLVVADGLAQPDADMGPLVNEAALSQVEAHVRDALGKGARLISGGEAIKDAPFARGHFYKPTVLLDTTPEMLCMTEETFGPVAPIASFRRDDEVLHLANASRYGLAAYLYTRDLERAMRFAHEIEAGGVGINVNDVSELTMPFGGWKESGIGRELGRYGLENYLNWKHVRIGL